MHNRYLDDRTAADVDSRVARVLRDLGNPEPPVRLELVRELLKLDLRHYTTADPSILQETVHKLRIGVKQVIKRPGLLAEVVQKWSLRALYLPDRKRILLDADLPPPKQRWGEAHEIGHSLLPWHHEVMLGDRQRTLSFACHEEIEAEANFTAGRLLFLQDAFAERLLSGEIVFQRVRALGKEFGNTMTSTLWRAVESVAVPAFGMVSQHPRFYHPELPVVRYFLRSREFERCFSNVTAREVFDVLGTFCFGKRGPIGQREVLLRDSNGTKHVFMVECFNNGHEVLTLGVFRHERGLMIAIS